MFFNKRIKNHRLASEDEKFQLLKKYGVDFVINIKFNRSFSKISGENFIKKIIFRKIYPKQIFVSNNFKFGNKRKGNINLLWKFSKECDYKLLKINPYKYRKKLISSTRIRKYLQKGDIELANKLLSRIWSISGRVIQGKKVGRKLGYRTCNIRIKNYLLPMAGIYAVKVSIENKTFSTNIFNVESKLYESARPQRQGQNNNIKPIGLFNLVNSIINLIFCIIIYL